MKLTWTKHYVLPTGGNNNDDAHSINIIFTVKDTKLFVPAVTLLAKDTQNYQNFLAKDLKDQFVWMNIKQKVKRKTKKKEYRYFL